MAPVKFYGIFFPYLGGKHFLLKELLKRIPPHDVYVEVFGGSAELLFHKPPSKIEVYNDIDGDLVNLFEVVRNNFDEFHEKAKWLLYSRQLNDEWKKQPMPNDKIERAVRTWYIYETSFAGKKFGSWGFGRSPRCMPKSFSNKIEKGLSKIHERLKNVYVDHLDFRKCIKNWDSPSTFFYMDPPYYQVEQANKISLKEKDYQDLAELCANVKGKFLITLNDAPFIRETFKDFKIETVESLFTGRAITSASKRKTRGYYTHLLISNY